MRFSTRVPGVIVVILLALPSIASAAPTPDADRFEVFFPAGDGLTTLHADVLRPPGLPRSVKTPVIMTVGPYFNQNDFVNAQETGPHRFYDFIDLTELLSKRYTYVMVDLPGFGGSSGCNDWGGFREQGAVVGAVRWAASQPWSTGKVGLMGKSYDAWTGLMGIARQPKGLAAVVAMEPVFSGYRYLYSDGVRFGNSFTTGLIFQLLDIQPGANDNTASYQLNGAPQAWCYGVNVGLQQQDDPDVPFWMERDLFPPSIGKRTPLFLTQGFLENNTKPDAAFDYFNHLSGPKRAWYGQFGHVRGWQRQGKMFLTGRAVFVDEMMRFFDRYLKGRSPPRDPTIAVQDNLGRYRAERTWPPRDAKMLWSELNAGAYADDGQNDSTGPNGGRGVWSFSQPLPSDAWMVGEPVVRVAVGTSVPRTNLVANVYDVAPNGIATLVSRGASLVRRAGGQRAVFELYGQDWVVRKGHRIAVLVSGANADWWVHVPTYGTVSVLSAEIGLRFLTKDRRAFLDGGKTPTLEEHMRSAYVIVDQTTIREGSRRFHLPAPLV